MHRIASQQTLDFRIYFTAAHQRIAIQTNHSTIFKHSTNLLDKDFSILIWSRNFLVGIPAAGSASELTSQISNNQQIFLSVIFQFIIDHGNYLLASSRRRPCLWAGWCGPFDRLTPHPNKQTTSQFSNIQQIFLSRIFQFLLDHGHFL